MPAAGEVLAGVAQADLPPTAVGQAVVEPSVLPPSGGKASGRLFVLSPTPLPKDAPVPAGGETVLHAVLPVAASRTFETAEPLQGKVHLDVLGGRESVWGKTGGNREMTVQSGDAILSVPAASLPEDAVVDVEETGLSSFLPAAPRADRREVVGLLLIPLLCV